MWIKWFVFDVLREALALCSEVFGDHSLLVDGSTEAGDGGGGYSNSTGVIINGGCQTEVRGGLKVSISTGVFINGGC